MINFSVHEHLLGPEGGVETRACTYNGAERHITCRHFENSTSKAIDSFILMTIN